MRYYEGDALDCQEHERHPRSRRPYAMTGIVGYEGADGAELVACVEGIVTPGTPPRLRADPDDCDPGEGTEVEIISITDEDTGEDVSAQVDDKAARQCLLHRGVW
jgi:hypothetical protein